MGYDPFMRSRSAWKIGLALTLSAALLRPASAAAWSRKGTS
jgi:hypothetical protein